MLYQKILFSVAAIAFSCTVYAQNAATFDNRKTVTIPRIDTPEQVAQYQNITFELDSNTNTWKLTGGYVLNSQTPGYQIGTANLDTVEVVKTTSFPVGIYLKAISANVNGCPMMDSIRINHKLVNSNFYVNISIPSYVNDNNNPQYGCTADRKPLNKTVVLPVYGLKAGTYSYDVNGITGTFTIDADNKFSTDTNTP
jgi:inhibitor of cysteine peptidase